MDTPTDEDKPIEAKPLDDPSFRIVNDSLLDGMKTQQEKEIVEPDLDDTKQAADSLEEEFSMPKEFQKKLKKDIVNDYLDLKGKYEKVEHRASKVGNELGELRQLYDGLIESKTREPKQAPQPIQFDDVVDNTDQTLRRAVNENPEVQTMRDQLAKVEQNIARQSFEAKHPDWLEVSESNQFSEFLAGNPHVAQMAQAANVQGNWEMGDAVMSMYKYAKGNQAKQTAEVERKETLKRADTETGSTGSASKKTWKRSQIIELQMKDPDEYARQRINIGKAYQRGDVVDDINF